MTDAESATSNRSAFVTGLAWVFIVLAGFATVIAILQNIMLTLMFPAEELRTSMREAERAQQTPALFRFMFENFRLFFAAFLVLSAGTLITAIGLLKRQNWARLVFIGIMVLGVVWSLASLAMPFIMSSLVPDTPPHAPPAFDENFKLMWKIMTGFTIVISLAFAALFAWIIKRLVAEDIRREFLAL